VENLFALTAFESGPVLSRALFQVKAIRREWTGLKRELGVLEPMALKRSIAHKAGLDIRALEIAEGEEIDSEARRAEAYLDLIAGAYDTWAQHSQDSLGAKAARLLQNVRSLNESARQLEAAFDLAEIGPDDRRSRRFGNANVSLQGFLEWIVEDSRQWIDELADGDTRGTVAKVIVEGAEIQSGVLDELKDYVEHNGIVGKARVLRAIGELHENLDRIQQQELPTF